VQEIEAKFFVIDLNRIRRRITALGGRLVVRRHLERNWRYDLPGEPLAKRRSLLRLRQDRTTTLTYKRRGRSIEQREELELQVADPTAAAELLAALGYRVIASYEKYRREYRLGTVRVMLDELPFGDFVEIEGPTLSAVRDQAARLGLAWERRVRSTYLDIFDELRAEFSLRPRQATFASLASRRTIRADRIGLRDAIRSAAGDP
jgi:adenylate cyclase class 2